MTENYMNIRWQRIPDSGIHTSKGPGGRVPLRYMRHTSSTRIGAKGGFLKGAGDHMGRSKQGLKKMFIEEGKAESRLFLWCHHGSR